MKNKVNIKVVPSGATFKVLSISGNSGDALTKHQVNQAALLLVKSGNLTYQADNLEVLLSEGQCHPIPANVLHAVTCRAENTQFFVVLTNQAKMRFES
ncbi:MAG: hypothetical protein AB8G86_06380 [Saprospiraceae bacterium]